MFVVAVALRLPCYCKLFISFVVAGVAVYRNNMCMFNKLCPVDTRCRNRTNIYIYIYTRISPCWACLHLLGIAGGDVRCWVDLGVLGWLLGSIGGCWSSGVVEQDCIKWAKHQKFNA